MTRGTCRECMRRRDVFRAQRSGGGTWYRGGRFYWSSICGECAVRIVARATPNASSGRWSVSTLLDAAESVDPAVVAAYRTRCDEARAARQARREEQQRT